MTASQELISIAGKLEEVSKLVESSELKGTIATFRDQIQTIGASHSGGHLGEEVDLYYKNFEIPPNRDNLIKDRGTYDGISYWPEIEVKAGWKKRTFEEVKARVFEKLGADQNSFISGLER